MNHKLIIANEQIRNRAMAIVEKLPVDGTVEVCIKLHKRNRSVDQNAIYWKWLTVIGNDLGNTKDEQHDIYKEMFLSKIFTRDDPEYSEMMEVVSQVPVKDGGTFLRKKIIDLTSTAQASVKQLGEYLDDVQHHATSLGIRLPAMEQ